MQVALGVFRAPLVYIESMQEEILNIIVRLSRGAGGDDDKARLLEWLEESEENRRFYSLFMANCSLHDTIASPSLYKDTESMIARLDARIDASESQRRWRLPLRSMGWVLASVAAVVLSFLVYRGVTADRTVPVPMETASNLTAETIHFVLDDGTRVYLQPGADITYNVSTLEDRREVRLRGDAYFDVSRNELKPFVVKTDNIGVKVLGTAFSVSSSPESSQVVLERGSVRLLSPEGASMVTLSPNQKATFKSLTGDVRVEPVYATAFVTDKYNLMSISDATLSEITARLSSIFHKKINFKGGDDDKRYNLAVLKSDTLEDILSILEYMTGAEFTFQ